MRDEQNTKFGKRNIFMTTII